MNPVITKKYKKIGPNRHFVIGSVFSKQNMSVLWKYFLFLIIMSVFNLPLFAVSAADSVFQAANKLYADGKYEEAIATYESVVKNRYESVELYYNLGNAYYKMREYPKAILNYERALLLDPGNDDVQFNLDKAKMYNIDKIDEIPNFILKKWITSLVSVTSSDIWAIVSLSTFTLFIITLLIYFLSMRISLKKTGFYLAVLFLIFTLITFDFAYKARKLQISNNSAIVMSPTVTVKSSPSETGNSMFVVHEGTKVEIVGHLDLWDEIRLSDGKQGWLLKSDVEEI